MLLLGLPNLPLAAASFVLLPVSGGGPPGEGRNREGGPGRQGRNWELTVRWGWEPPAPELALELWDVQLRASYGL